MTLMRAQKAMMLRVTTPTVLMPATTKAAAPTSMRAVKVCPLDKSRYWTFAYVTTSEGEDWDELEKKAARGESHA